MAEQTIITGGPRYMRKIGTKKIGSHITNSHIKRPRMTVDWGLHSRKLVNLQSQIHEFADKKTAYNEVHLYLQRNRCGGLGPWVRVLGYFAPVPSDPDHADPAKVGSTFYSYSPPFFLSLKVLH